MNEVIRFGDITGYDDAEIIEIDDGVYIAIEKESQDSKQEMRCVE